MLPQIVIDTNVITSALRSRRGASHRLVTLAGTERFGLHLSVPLLLEYEQVAKRLLGQIPLTEREIDDILDYPPYNFMLHTSPLNDEENEHYHWHIEVMPKLTKIAGFEWGSGFYINPTPPEEAARFLRDAEKS